jgi:hypothetical protein
MFEANVRITRITAHSFTFAPRMVKIVTATPVRSAGRAFDGYPLAELRCAAFDLILERPLFTDRSTSAPGVSSVSRSGRELQVMGGRVV